MILFAFFPHAEFAGPKTRGRVSWLMQLRCSMLSTGRIDSDKLKVDLDCELHCAVLWALFCLLCPGVFLLDSFGSWCTLHFLCIPACRKTRKIPYSSFFEVFMYKWEGSCLLHICFRPTVKDTTTKITVAVAKETTSKMV